MTDHVTIHQNDRNLALEFPAHIQRVLGKAGIIVGIADLLKWHADTYGPEKAPEAKKLREIAAQHYGEELAL